MKKITIISVMFLSLCSYVTKATVHTVSNSPISAGQYTVVDSAIVHASVNDTVYVHGSAFDYGTVHITKRITLIGAGYNVTGTAYNLNTMVDGITIDSAAFSLNPVNGTQIIAIHCTGSISPSVVTSNVYVGRCAVAYINTNGGQGWIIENNIITGYIDFYGGTNTINSCIVRNNFISGSLYANALQTAPGLLVDHNIFEGNISTINYATITNNIFFFANISGSPNNSFNVYNNNITVNATADVLPFGTNSGTGNINNVLPTNAFASGLTSPQTYPNLLNYDWHINASGPAHAAATDGSDIGIYGGAHAMPNFTGASTLPQINLMNISNSSIPLNGTLNYEFKAREEN